ncbi:MAG: DUF1552 domain-containing protein [Pseudomonadota bacterium]|jgi:Chromosome segregation ATPases|nr:MAG: hypothetical protein DIU56_11195 [Pseudomonadota bacterium]
MFITKKHLSRRTVLRGLGASISLPLLDAMIPAGTALANTAAKPAPRLAFVYFPHGAVMDRWSPTATGRDFEISPILAPLEPFRSHLTIVSGLRNKGGESSDPHGIIAGTWLSCVGPKDRDGTGDRGITADQLAARYIGQDTPLPSLELSTETGGPCSSAVGCGFGSTVSFRTPFQPLPMENNPRKVFYQLFGQGDTSEERRAIIEETGSILDFVTDRAVSLQRRLGPADRTRVSDYLDSVREIERRIQKLMQSGAANADLPDAPVGIPSDFAEHLGVMFELMALAFQANQTRVISFMMAKEVSMRTYNQIGVPDAFHPLSHHQNDPAKLDKLVRIQTYHTDIFARRFVKRLAEMEDGDGTMLDHSLILFGSNMSNSDLHNNDPLPSAILGRGCGRVKGGQHLKYPQDTPHANLLVTLLNRAGVPIESFADATGELSEV